ncbi:MAG: hypothetical protein UW42_C0058G0012 [Candidatus Collierbacteria bacterium GW2011_GWB1_44_197]|nr:MAG: hypothetical protein UW42_C0058G0012 [Candidatus Collierbacteria bacterium GW2011_GWB1_44_197]
MKYGNQKEATDESKGTEMKGDDQDEGKKRGFGEGQDQTEKNYQPLPQRRLFDMKQVVDNEKKTGKGVGVGEGGWSPNEVVSKEREMRQPGDGGGECSFAQPVK